MQPATETKNLGFVLISSLAIKSFSKQKDIDIIDATDEVIRILKSSELERLHVPSHLKSHLQNHTAQIEFWVHRKASCIFSVMQNHKGKVVSMVLKKDMNDHLLGNVDS